MKLSGYETFCLYLALKNHFTQKSYDFFKYHGKTSASKDSFSRRRDKYLFEKLSRKYEAEEMRDFIVANLLAGKTWVGDMLEDDAAENYKNRIKVLQSLSYMFANEVDRALSGVAHPKELFTAPNGELPPIVEMVMREEISLETFVILNAFIGFIPKMDERLGDHYLWEKVRDKAVKYAPFVTFDRKKMTEILKEKMK